MKRNGLEAVILLFMICTLVTCIDPFSPKLYNFKSLLVVDALLTDEYASNTVILSRTKETADAQPEMVSGALVIIKDDIGVSTTLIEKSEGIYKTDSLTFRGETGRSYSLYIKTADGNEYESGSCLMYPVQNIDSIYFFKDQKMEGNESKDGISICIDSGGESNKSYSRWTFEEWWKISVPCPKKYIYVNESTFIKCSTVKETCWGHNKSSEIIINSQETAFSQPILFIQSDKSSRLLIQYCIKVRQLSLSGEEYNFWDRMSQINETGGDIFDKQPFQIYGNITNINDPDEKVLGYFQVSAAKVKMKYITYPEIEKLGIPHYQYDCKISIVGPSDYPVAAPPTFDQIYNMYTNLNYIFIEPQYKDTVLTKLVFATPLCADCTYSGSLTRPDFWTDLN